MQRKMGNLGKAYGLFCDFRLCQRFLFGGKRHGLRFGVSNEVVVDIAPGALISQDRPRPSMIG